MRIAAADSIGEAGRKASASPATDQSSPASIQPTGANHDHRRSQRNQRQRSPRWRYPGRREGARRGRPHSAGRDAGRRAIRFPDAEYQNAGAEIVGEAGYVWGKAEIVVKVKEPIEQEYVYFREGLVLFTYLHLAPLPALTDKLLESKVIGIAYETVRDRQGTLPLLTPMSEVAGRMSVQVGATYLERNAADAAFFSAACPACPRLTSASSAEES